MRIVYKVYDLYYVAFCFCKSILFSKIVFMTDKEEKK